jgi:phosphatidylglycerophosphatase A
MRFNMDKHSRSPLKNISLKNPWHLIATGFGSGLAPKAPGTFGSLAAVPLCALLIYCPVYVQILVALITFIIGTKAASETEKAMGMHDNSSIVIDEFDGMFIAVIAFPHFWYYSLLAFVLFRIFDILKPWPVSLADKKIGGGLGVMVDDVIAGIMALGFAHVIFYICSII